MISEKNERQYKQINLLNIRFTRLCVSHQQHSHREMVYVKINLERMELAASILTFST